MWVDDDVGGCWCGWMMVWVGVGVGGYGVGGCWCGWMMMWVGVGVGG